MSGTSFATFSSEYGCLKKMQIACSLVIVIMLKSVKEQIEWPIYCLYAALNNMCDIGGEKR